MRYVFLIILVVYVLIAVATMSFAAVYGLNSRSGEFELDNSEFLSITDASQTGLDITGDMTVVAWVNPEDLSNNAIVGKWNSTGNQRGYIFHLVTAIRTDFRFSTTGTDANTHVCNAGEGVALNVWTHVAVTYDASAGTCLQYKNGQHIYTEASLGNVINDSTATFSIGRRDDGDLFFDGLLDEVMIFDRILTGAEINDLYTRKGQKPFGWDANLQGYWQLNELSGTRTDQTDNANDLTDNNTVTALTDVPFVGSIPGGI